MTKHDAMKAYFEPKVEELAKDLLGFNYSSASSGSISLITNYSDKVRKRYLRFGAEKEYGFTIILVKDYSTSGDDLNLEAMNFAQAFMDWIDEKNGKKEYPDFGERCQIKRIENLQNMPNLSGVNIDNNLAQYMIQCRVIYFEKAR